MAPSNRDRQRAAARARLEREMTERAQAVRRQRRLRLQIAGTVLAVVLVAVVVTVVAESGGGKKKKPTAAGPSASASPAACAWQPRLQANPSAPPQPTPSGVKDVGTPPKSGEPRSGTQTMTIDTNLGPITAAVDDSKVPCTARSFSYLAEKHFFDNTQCHRMTNSGLYVLQCGDPSASGTGGPTYQFADENLPNGKRPAYPEGVLAMANSGPGTNGSQFFIVYKDSELDPNYTVVGKLTAGLDLVKKVADAGLTPTDPSNPNDGKPKTPVTIKTLTMSTPAQS